MTRVVKVVALTLAVGLLPGLWVVFSPDGSAARMRAALGLVDDGDARSHAFTTRQSVGGAPVGYDPCRPIRYVVDPAGAPEDWRRLVEDATGVITAASGLEFDFRGVVADRDFDRRPGLLGRERPALIAWSDADEHPPLAGDVAGLGGSVAAGRPGRLRYVTGTVVLDREDAADMTGWPGSAARVDSLLVHELGHLVGLDHTDDATQLMYAEETGVTDLGRGDREGLRVLGSLGDPCG